MLTGESRFHISTPPPQGIWTRVPCDGKQTGSPLNQWDTVRMKWDCRLSTGLPPSSRLRQLWSQKGDLQRAWNRDRKAVWDQVGLSHCWHEGLVMVRDEAHLRQGHNDQSRRGHQCSETTLTGESRFHISTPEGIWTWVPCDGKQTDSQLDEWDMVRMKWDCRLSTVVKYVVSHQNNSGHRRDRELGFVFVWKALVWRITLTLKKCENL
jgi:hypothetical protein